MKSYIVHLFVFIILLGLFNQGFGADADQLIENNLQAVETYEEAYAQALKYTGFDKSKDFKRPERVSDICQLVTTKDTTNAFLADEVSNRIAWQVKLQNVSLHLKGNTPEGIILGPVDFIILIDSLTGIPLRISSIPKEPFEREATSLEDVQLLGQAYEGLPSELPVLPIFEILNGSEFYPAIAKLITIIYVSYSANDSPPEPAWVVYLRGLPAFYPERDTLSEYNTTRRYIYNAVTGFGLAPVTNYPYPILSNDK